MNIIPTVGRVMWYWMDADEKREGAEPFAATVASTSAGGTLVNVRVVDHDGEQFSNQLVPVIQEGQELPASGAFVEWMPYQVGQAKKTEGAMSKALGEPDAGPAGASAP